MGKDEPYCSQPTVSSCERNRGQVESDAGFEPLLDVVEAARLLPGARAAGNKSGGSCHGVGKKALRKFKGFFWSSKPEDALCDSQKFLGVNHRSLACETKP
jgi:hypothetical protein